MKKLLLCLAAAGSCVFAYAQTTITKSATLFYNSGSGQAWTNPANAQTSDNLRAVASVGSLIGSGSSVTQLLVAQDFGFAVPQEATILAVRLRLERRNTTGDAFDQTIQLVKGGYLSGTNKAATATAWPTTEAIASYGNTTTDLWGTSFTAFDINSNNFGVAIAATLHNPNFFFGSAGGDVDHVEMSVTYTTAGLPDRDSDGVADAIDFDADNDGIPNNREMAITNTSTFSWSGQPDGTLPANLDITSGGLTTNIRKTGTPTLTTFAINNSYSATTEKEVVFNQTASTPSSRTTLTLTFNKAIAFPQFLLQDIDASPGQFIDNLKVTASYLGQTYNLSATEFTTSVCNSYSGGNTFTGVSIAGDNTILGQVSLKLNTIIDKLVIEYWNSDVAAGAQGVGLGGITFTDVTGVDTDGDGLVNHLDTDSDGDGLPDLAESGGVDTNGDGRIDGTFADTDGDGLNNKYDASSGGVAIANLDTDGDGVTNALDLDSDNDGLPDAVEAGAADSNNDGRADATGDTDGDGLVNSYDGDSNNDGTAENTAGARMATGTDGNADGIPDTYGFRNTDKQGLPDAYDMDADGDGLTDALELGITDADKNGVADGADANADGWSDAADALAAITPLNTDGDAVPDYKDIDSDNDGITDNVEGLSTAGYLCSSVTDSDGDGLADVYDNNDAAFAGGTNNGVIPVNTDGDGLPDYRDPDTDNDGVLDRTEGHDYNLNGLADDDVSLTGVDTDGDGLDDKFDLSTEPYVNQTGMLNGGLSGTPGNSGAVGPLQKTNVARPDRDWRYSNGNALAIRLVQFAAAETGNGVAINWRTANAEDVAEYQLQKSTDGLRFTTFGRYSHRAGTNADTLTVPDAATTARVYYRLLIVETGGKVITSPVISMGKSNSALLNVYPNPASGSVTVQLPAGVSKLTMYNAAGVAVSTRLVGSSRSVMVDVSRLTPGFYTVQTATANKNLASVGLLVR